MDQQTLFTDNPEYDAFVEKFKPKLTTDDCYTPPLVYDAVREWVCQRYGTDPETIVRPFYPGGDYEHFPYPDGCLVLDNPPFSILAQICAFYLDRGIHFFLFAPSLTAFSGKNTVMRINHIICDADITYHNGATVRTAFVTDLDRGVVAETAPALGEKVNAASKLAQADKKRTVPKYSYPMEIVTAAMLQRYANYGVDFRVRAEDCVRVSKLDAKKESKKTIFGGGLLLSERAATERAAAERAAAERAAAERAAAKVWELSEREREIVRGLGRDRAQEE